MPEFHSKVTIDLPREEVFTYIVNSETQVIWQSGLQEFDADWSGEPTVGDRSRGTVKVAGKKLQWETEVVEIKRPETFVFRSVKAPFPFHISFSLLQVGDSTEVRYDGSTEAMGGFFGKLADPLVAHMYQRDMNSNLANLKAILEET
ncbi:SRPBCC family protein [Nesterenkonia sp. LB17]|uniref:SRPBCC family protein n=1 Tax=unclassified Nesterenkonia TaxID=2629769 RepID=UPI001F4D0248|nr:MULTISPECIES: SRPBCC family protein [unclassified Nesterenkonia]MCH8563138.1 SRPBCC family protein [Nesterenkonia sp. YGD6]MCH8565045.1 SRPBCC family protein [Nesterenkonia sp. LB17]